ncbi:PspC domain-containing protein [Pseudoscardovia radai]|uniref:PspC domain-containing protein n=1 Tax=Pseudoscardovia radai TaxID=987066 RepID=UPI003993D4A3
MNAQEPSDRGPEDIRNASQTPDTTGRQPAWETPNGQAPYGDSARENPPDGKPVGHGFFDWIRSWGIERSSRRWIGGVSGGIANRLGWDPLVIRIIWLALAMAGGLGLMLYGLVWMLLPDERDGTILLESAIERGECSGGFWMALVFILLGTPALAPISIPLALLLAVALIVLYLSDRHSGFSRSRSYRERQGTTVGGAAPDHGIDRGADTRAASAGSPRRVVHSYRPISPAIAIAFAGIILVSLGVILLLERGSGISTPDFLFVIALWAAGSTLALGLTLIIAGLAGHKSGALGPLSVIMLIIALMATSAQSATTSLPIDGIRPGDAGVTMTSSTVTYASKDLPGLKKGLNAQMSTVTIDLRDWSDSHGSACPTGTIPMWATASTVRVLLPSGCKASVNDDEPSVSGYYAGVIVYDPTSDDWNGDRDATAAGDPEDTDDHSGIGITLNLGTPHSSSDSDATGTSGTSGTTDASDTADVSTSATASKDSGSADPDNVLDIHMILVGQLIIGN